MTEQKLWPYRYMNPAEIGRRLLESQARDFKRDGVKNFVIGFSYQGGETILSRFLSNPAEVGRAYEELLKLSKNKEYVGWLAVPIDKIPMFNQYKTRTIGEEKHFREANP